MDKNENIYIKLEIGKDPANGNLTIMTRFDPTAPNFTDEGTWVRWNPTDEERQFLNEAFEMCLRAKK